MSEKSSEKKVTIIGLGQMGKKLAQIWSAEGYEVTVWNRSPEKAQDLNVHRVASDVTEAISANDVIAICVLDNSIVFDLLDRAGSIALAGRTIINFTTGSPGEVKNLETSLAAAGAYYLNGAIQVAPEQMAMSDTTILMAGSKNAFEQHRTLLDKLGGNIKYLGEKGRGITCYGPCNVVVGIWFISWVDVRCCFLQERRDQAGSIPCGYRGDRRFFPRIL